MAFLFFIFIAVVPFLLLYSAGYRIDWENLTFEKTGGIFIHSDLSETRVFVNEEFVESGGVILRNTLVQDLNSNEVYKIRVEKDGYLPWYKDLIVYPNLVTEARIMMIPEKINFETIEQFSYVPATTTLSKATSTKITNKEYKEVLDLFSASSTTATTTLAAKFNTKVQDISSTTVKIVENIVPEYLKKIGIENPDEKEQFKENSKMVAWLESGNIHVVWAGDKQSTPFFFCDIRGCRDKVLISLDTEIEKFDFFPGRNDAFIVSTKNHIFAVEADDRSKQNLQTIFEGKKPEFKLVGNTIFIKDGQALYKTEI